jgi:hypothetical protein
MFQMFGFGGVKCPRCEHKNNDDSGYCAACGMTLGAPRNERLLRDNRWSPGADELAVFFGVRALSGVFVKTLHLPAATRAYILQDDKVTEVPRGDYEIDGFFARLGHLLRDKHAEVLVARAEPLPVEFAFSDLHSAENLLVSARFTIGVEIGQVAAFARHFMTLPGAVGGTQLRELLAPSVRQLAAEFVAAQSIRDMAANRDLRVQLDERLQGSLKMRLAQYGLAVARVDTLALRHDKLDAHRERIGTLWLVVDQGQAELEHARQLDQLYSDEEWQRIWREEQERRLRYRRAELRQDETIERAELSLQNSERAQAIRAREIDLYARIVDAKARRQAIERGAGEVLAELELELAKKGAGREDESMQWAQLRQLAQIRMRTELEIAQQDAIETRQLAQQRFAHQLLQQQIENKIAQALGIEDEARKRAELARLHESEQAAARRELEIEEEQHRARRESLALAHAAHRREAERVQEWEDQLALERQRELLRGDRLAAEEVGQKVEAMRRSGAQAEAIAQYEKLLRTIEADGLHARQGQQLQLEADERRHALRRLQQETEWQQELRRLEHARDEKFAQLAHHVDIARIEIARVEAIGAMGDSAKLALAAAPNAAALAELMKTQVHAGMSPEQLAALAGVASAGAGVAPVDALRLAQEQVQQERARRDAETDRDRRHQLDLLGLQNDVNKAALFSQSQLGVGVALARAPAAQQRQCANGHAAGAHDKFCAQCGAALPP